MALKNCYKILMLFFFTSIVSQEKLQIQKDAIPEYVIIPKDGEQKEIKLKQEMEKIVEKKVIEEKKIVEEKPKIPTLSQYSNVYLSRIFDNSILNSQKISLKSGKSKIQNLIDLIAKGTGIDFVIDPDVKGITGKLSFKNKTPGFVLNYILTHNNPQLALIRDMNVFRIMLRTKAEDYFKIIEKNEIVSEVLNINNSNINEKFTDLLTKAWENITLESKAYSFMFIDTDRKKIFLKGFPKNIAEFKKYFNAIDKSVTQIRIDAIVLFAEKDYKFNFGFNWGGIYNRLNTIQKKGTAFDFVGLGSTLFDFPEPTTPIDAQYGNLFVDPIDFAFNLADNTFITPRDSVISPVTNFSTTSIDVPFVFGGPDLNLRRLNVVLRAAEAEAKVKIIARPSLMTSDNEVAKILIGQAIPLSAAAIDVLSVAVQNIVSINYKDIGITLEISPSVSPDKQNIQLDVLIEESEVIDGNTSTSATGIMNDPPVIDMIKIRNYVNLKNGQTAVIGGISRCDERRRRNKVPWLNRIPIIGRFFLADAEFKEEFEQYIFITPTIVD